MRYPLSGCFTVGVDVLDINAETTLSYTKRNKLEVLRGRLSEGRGAGAESEHPTTWVHLPLNTFLRQETQTEGLYGDIYS